MSFDFLIIVTQNVRTQPATIEVDPKVTDCATENIDENTNPNYENASFMLLINLSRIIADDYDKSNRKFSSKIDKKLCKDINRKNYRLE